MDIDPTSTLKGEEYTIAYISFHYGGNIIETRKEVQTLLESLSIIGNIFNISPIHNSGSFSFYMPQVYHSIQKASIITFIFAVLFFAHLL